MNVDISDRHQRATIRSLLTLEVREGRVVDLVDFFDQHGILKEAVSRRCRHAELWRPVGGGPLLVSAEWLRATDYDAWRADPVRMSWSDGLSRLTTASSSQVYEVVQSARRADA